MEMIKSLFGAQPIVALFVTIALGYLAGKIRVGRFVLGGIAGTLLVGVAIGQFDIKLDSGIKDIFFALFIYAVGYQGGPQFFHALNLRSLNQLLSAFLMCLTGLLCVLIAAWSLGLDRGTAAGLAAGGLTQSAIIGTAGDAISKLDATPEQIKTMQTNVAVGYAVCYIFGSLGPIIMVTWFFPTIMGWDIRAEAIKLAKQMSGGQGEIEAGQFNAARQVDTRFFGVIEGPRALGMTVAQLDQELGNAAVEAILRDGSRMELSGDVTLIKGDVVAITGRVAALENVAALVGSEVAPPDGLELIEENRAVIMTNREYIGKSLQELRGALGCDSGGGAFIVSIQRMGRELQLLPALIVHRGDELILTGRPADLDRVQKQLGYKINAAAVTDFIAFGLGLAIGVLIGMVEFKVAGVPVTVGTGGGCLLSGLLFGWLRSVHPSFAALPTGASNFLRDFGLAVFVGVVGITAGPQALVTVKQYGLTLFFLGVGVTIIPQIIVFFISYYVLRIRNPIEALGCLVGGRSANPGFAALLDKAGNATPVVSFTITYAVANVFLTLWGPLIVGIITKNP